jgi:hypothetical protein
MRRLLLTILALILSAPALAADKEYDGADAGHLVYAVGTLRIGMHFDFNYRRLTMPDGAPADDWKGKIRPRLGGAIYLKVKNPDFNGEETGHVVIRRLPPGTYAVQNFFFAGSSPGGGGVYWSPANPFALPFTIRRGAATYIGSFMRSPSLGTPLQPALGAAGFFIVADRSARDLPIATPRLPAGVKVTGEVTDVSTFGSPVLRTAVP